MADDVEHQHFMETYRSLITIALASLKYLSLINGGAAVALLAYLGNVASRTGPAPSVTGSMVAFVTGLVFCGIAFLAAYFTQFVLLNESASRPLKVNHGVLLWVGIGSAMLSLASFAYGAITAAEQLSQQVIAAG